MNSFMISIVRECCQSRRLHIIIQRNSECVKADPESFSDATGVKVNTPWSSAWKSLPVAAIDIASYIEGRPVIEL